MTKTFTTFSFVALLMAATWGCSQSKNIENQNANVSIPTDSNRLAEQVMAQIKSTPYAIEGKKIDLLLAEGLTKSMKNRREVDVFVIEVPSGQSLAYRSQLQDLPEVLTLRAGSTTSRATLGWNWQTRPKADGGQEWDPPPIGALLRIEDKLIIGETKLSKGTLLQYTGKGWGIINPNDARIRISQIMALPNQVKEGAASDAREAAALGAILLDDQSIAPDLLAIARRSDNVAPYACVTLARIGDSSLLSTLEELATLHASRKNVADELHRAIDKLRRK
jgi:hypothetical protein